MARTTSVREECDYPTYRKYLGKRAEESQHLPLSFNSRRSNLALLRLLLVRAQGAGLVHNLAHSLDVASKPVQRSGEDTHVSLLFS